MSIGSAQRPAIIANAKVEISLEADACENPRSVVKSVTVQVQMENSVPT